MIILDLSIQLPDLTKLLTRVLKLLMSVKFIR